MDTATKKNYFLFEGDSEDGIELVKADYDGEKAMLRKGAEEVWMDMNAAVAPTPAIGAATAAAPALRRSIPLPPVAPEAPAKTQLTGEALKTHLKEYQMELIRAGGKKGPPLPMPLTPEMDAKLVEEGVLPSVE